MKNHCCWRTLREERRMIVSSHNSQKHSGPNYTFIKSTLLNSSNTSRWSQTKQLKTSSQSNSLACAKAISTTSKSWKTQRLKKISLIICQSLKVASLNCLSNSDWSHRNQLISLTLKTLRQSLSPSNQKIVLQINSVSFRQWSLFFIHLLQTRKDSSLCWPNEIIRNLCRVHLKEVH